MAARSVTPIAVGPTDRSRRDSSFRADPGADLVGSGCAGYAEKVPSGPGSVSGMTQDPVVTAASNNPLLTTLTAALSGKLNPGSTWSTLSTVASSR